MKKFIKPTMKICNLPLSGVITASTPSPEPKFVDVSGGGRTKTPVFKIDEFE